MPARFDWKEYKRVIKQEPMLLGASVPDNGGI